MKYHSQLRKMQSEFSKPIQYYLDMGSDFLNVNQLLGKKVVISKSGYSCMHCTLDKPLYRMGYCKQCFFELPQTNESIIRPELSTAHLGKAQRDLEWEQNFELQPHIVYLAVTSGLKVGVTRKVQVPTRWIDQGAKQAIVLAETENRYEAGQIEVELAKHVADKTSYQKMLKNEFPVVDLIHEKAKLSQHIPDVYKKYVLEESSVWDLDYPVQEYPTKVKSLKLEKVDRIEKVLSGIKGQYWIFDDQTVWNVRQHEGFVVNIELL